MAENDEIVEEGTEPANEPAANEPAPEAKAFTQADVDAVVSARLRSEADKQERERLRYEAEIARRDAYIQGLATNRGAPNEDPYADLSEDEKSLIRVSERATSKLEKKMEAFMQGVAQTIAPIAAQSQVAEFFENKGKVPDSVQKKTMHYLRTLGGQGVNMHGAFKLAMADYAEDIVAGRVSPSAPGAAPARKPAAQVPHVEVGGARRSLTPNAPTANDDNMSWKQFRQEAEKARKRAPMEGAVYGQNGAEDYRDYDAE